MLKPKIVLLLIFLTIIIPSFSFSVDGSKLQTRRIINVNIQEFAFHPSIINVTVNEEITFNVTNLDRVTHTFTVSNSSFNVDITLLAGQNKEVNFNAPSIPQTIGFSCTIHTFMTGSIIVSSLSNPSSQTSVSSKSSTASTQKSGSQTPVELFPILASLVLIGTISWNRKKLNRKK